VFTPPFPIKILPPNEPEGINIEAEAASPILPVIDKEPDIIWFPTNVFEPVVANTVESNPSNKFELVE
jgi:hypothetical protein